MDSRHSAQPVPMKDDPPAARSLRRLAYTWQQLPRYRRAIELALAAAIGMLALTLFVYYTNSVSLWYDEIFSLSLSSLPLSVFAKVHQANMLLYYVLLHNWLNLTGALGIVPSPLVARLPSIVTMAAAAIVTFLFGSRFWSMAVGAIGSVLFILNALILEQAQQARGYALQLLLICLAWYALLLALKNPSEKRWWVVYAGMNILAMYSQLITVFMVVAQVLVVLVLMLPPIARRAEDLPKLIELGWRAYLRPGSIALISIIAASVPLALDARTHHGDISWVPIATLDALLRFWLAQTLNGLTAIALLITTVLGIVLGVTTRRGLPILLIAWGVVPIAMQYLLSQPTPNLHFFYPRYLIASLPALMLLAAIGLTQLRPKWGASFMILLLLALMIQVPGNYYPYSEVQPFRETTNWMEARYKTGDGVICRPDSKLCGIPIAYYLAHIYTGPETMPSDFPGIYVWSTFRSTPTDAAALTSYLASHEHIFVFTVAPIGGDPHLITDSVPNTLVAAGYKLTASYRPATKGDLGDVQVDEYSR